MRLKKLLITSVLLFVLVPVSAKESITGIEKSKYERSENSNKRVEIKNVNVDGEYIQGSKFQLQDENGIVLYEYKSPNEIFIIEGLEEGIYYLVQTEVSEEYELNTDKQKFSISNDPVKIEFINQNLKALPGSMSQTSILLMFMAMLNITIIIGVTVYVKKNKK